MSSWHTQADVHAVLKVRVAAQLTADIAAYDGSPQAAKQILRGIVAARTLEIDLGAFEDALAAKHRELGLGAA